MVVLAPSFHHQIYITIKLQAQTNLEVCAFFYYTCIYYVFLSTQGLKQVAVKTSRVKYFKNMQLAKKVRVKKQKNVIRMSTRNALRDKTKRLTFNEIVNN